MINKGALLYVNKYKHYCVVVEQTKDKLMLDPLWNDDGDNLIISREEKFSIVFNPTADNIPDMFKYK